MTKPKLVTVYCQHVINGVVCGKPRRVAAHCANRTKYCDDCRRLRQQEADKRCRLKRQAVRKAEKTEKPTPHSHYRDRSLQKMVKCKCPCCGIYHTRQIWFAPDMDKNTVYRKFCGACTKRAETLDFETYSISQWIGG